jgi:AmmeMemoRadiSam system protein A
VGEQLSGREKSALLSLARQAIECAVRGDQAPPADLSDLPGRLGKNGSSFVTLLGPGGELRGCIGTVEAYRPLAHDVQRNAASSALNDPRFLPVGPEELDRLKIELSILTPPGQLCFDSPDDLLTKIRPGVDGLIVEKGWQRATLLPSVWARLPDAVQFLSTLCAKAGLPEDAWRRPGLVVYVYQAEKVVDE